MSENLNEPVTNPFAAPSVDAISGTLPVDLPLHKYSTVRTGLNLIYYSVAAAAILFILMIPLAFVAVDSGGSGLPTALIGIAFLAVAFGIVLAIVVGACLCLACPNRNEKRFAIASVVLLFFCLGVTLLGGIFLRSFTPTAHVTFFLLRVASQIASIAGMFTFCLMLKRIGQNISSQRLQKSTQVTMAWLGILICVGVVGFGILMFLVAGSSGTQGVGSLRMLMIPFSLAMLVLTLGSLFLYLAMLRNGINELTINKPQQPQSHA